MATGKMLRDVALGLEGTEERPHFERMAFRVRRVYVTLAGDEKTANFWFTPEEQEMKCAIYPDAFAPLPNKWGAQGWTRCTLSKLTRDELRVALETAYAHGAAKHGRGKA